MKDDNINKNTEATQILFILIKSPSVIKKLECFLTPPRINLYRNSCKILDSCLSLLYNPTLPPTY